MKWYHYIIIGLVLLLAGTRFPSAKVKGMYEAINVILLTFGTFFLGMGRGRYGKEQK